MKNISRLLAAIMIVSLFVSAFATAPAALSSEDWIIVNHPSGTPNNAQISTTEDGGIRLSHEGHYPASNAGLMYNKPLDLKNGISMNVTVETDNSASSDVWYGVMFLDKPVYFDAMTGGNSDADAHGIIALTRPGSFSWWTFPGFSNVKTVPFTDLGDKEYYGEGVNMTYDLKLEDGSLFVYVDDNKVDYDFKDVLGYFDEGVYAGFSMSMTELEYQSFVINYLNGEKPASEGPAMTAVGGETKPVVEEGQNIPEGAKSFVLADFTDPEYVASLTGNDCKISFDEAENAMKVEVTGGDPYVNIPVTKGWYFDGIDYTVARLAYKTDVDCIGEFYFTTKEVPSMALCNVTYPVDATNGEWSEIIQDMDDSSNWLGQVRSFRIDPNQGGSEGEVFYYKTLTIEVYEEEETTARDTTKADESKEDDTTGNTADNTENTADPGKDVTTNTGSETGKKSNTGLIIGIIAGVVVVAAAVAGVVIAGKKKKK